MRLNVSKIKELIKRTAGSQTKLSQCANVSRPTINAICRGASCSEATAVKIAQALGVPLYELEERRR